ncbi:MAG: MerR family DNA-binding transcriptional regulator [Tepidisphaeraceae bacterium]
MNGANHRADPTANDTANDTAGVLPAQDSATPAAFPAAGGDRPLADSSADQPHQERWVTFDEAIAIAGVSANTWRRWVAAGRIAAGVKRAYVGSRGRTFHGPLLWPIEAALAVKQPVPGEGDWIGDDEAAALFGIHVTTWQTWATAGKTPWGAAMPPAVSMPRLFAAHAKGYSRAAVQTLLAGRDAAVFPPAGFVDKDQAALRLGVTHHTLREWVQQGVIDYAGEFAVHDGVRHRVYDIALLDAAVERMRANLAARAILPEGFIDRDETARRLGIVPDTLALWHTNGRLCCGVWNKTPDGKRAKIYPEAEVEALRQRLAEAPVLPEGYVDIDGACELLGISRQSWVNWSNEGKLPEGEWGRSPTNKPCRIYNLDEVRAAIDKIRGDDCVYKLAGRGKAYHIPAGWVQLREAAQMFGVNETTILRWESEGQITCGRTEGGQRIKIYAKADLQWLVEENGRYAPPYPDPGRPGVWRVPLSGHDMRRREAIIDEADLPLVEGRRFHFSFPGDQEGEPRHGRVATGTEDGRTRLHSLIMNVEDDLCVMHRNDDPLDCRRENLVVRTLSEKSASNRKARMFCGRPPSSRFKGVCWDKRRERWIAQIKKDGVSRSLGGFHDELAAAEAYDEAARELFGEHARLNFADGIDARLEQEHALQQAA